VPVGAVDLGPLGEAAASTAAIYVFLIILLRVLGRRQLGQLSVIDLVVILLLGSAVETAMIHGNTSLPVGLASAGTLLFLDRGLALALSRSRRLSVMLNGGPVLLVHDGRIVDRHLARAGMTRADLAEALRSRGFSGPERVRDAVLEMDGTVSVIGQPAR